MGVESTLRRTSEGMRRSMLHSTASESATTVATGHPPDGAVLWQTRCDSYTAVMRWAQSWAFTSVVWRRMHGRTRVRRLQQRAPREAGALLGSGTARGSLWCATDCVTATLRHANLRLPGVRPPHILALGDLHRTARADRSFVRRRRGIESSRAAHAPIAAQNSAGMNADRNRYRMLNHSWRL